MCALRRVFRTRLLFLHALLFRRVLLEESERLLELRLIELSAERRAIAGSPQVEPVERIAEVELVPILRKGDCRVGRLLLREERRYCACDISKPHAAR